MEDPPRRRQHFDGSGRRLFAEGQTRRAKHIPRARIQRTDRSRDNQEVERATRLRRGQGDVLRRRAPSRVVPRRMRRPVMPRRSDWRLCAGAHAVSKTMCRRHLTRGRARCVSCACSDLCGGRGVSLVPTATLPTMPSQLFRLRQKFFKDIAPFAQALMLKTLPDRFDHWSASACRLRPCRAKPSAVRR